MIDLILSTGTNLGDRRSYLNLAKEDLSQNFSLIEESPIFESPAVDYEQQPDFLNQVLHFEVPEELSAIEVLKITASLEQKHGRKRDIDKGPRTLDIDILFYGLETINTSELQIPHPRQFHRSFIVSPLRSLKIYQQLASVYDFPEKFDNRCWLYKA